MNLDTEKTGWESVLGFDHLAVALQLFINKTHEDPDFSAGSRTVWDHVKDILPPKPGGKPAVSRATVINGLNSLVDMTILGYEERTGKGGYHRVYNLALSSKEIQSFFVGKFTEHLLRTFPTVYATARARSQ